MEKKNDDVKDISRVLAAINRKAGSRVIGRLSTMDSIDVERIKTGIETLDGALGGGFPTRRMIELYGLPSGGKSLISMILVAAAQKEDKTCIYLDIEDSYDPKFGEKLGIDNDKLIIGHIGIGEDVIDVIVKLLEAEPDVIVVDSIAAMVPREDMEKEADDQSMAVKARLLSRALPKITTLNKKTTIIFINQLRATMVRYGKKTTTPGGRALSHYCGVRLEVRRGKWINKDNRKSKPVIGQHVNFRVTKNKTATPYKRGAFRFYYETGECVEPGKKRKIMPDEDEE